MLLYALKSTEDSHNDRPLLKPTEVEEKAHEVIYRYLNGAVSVFCASKDIEIEALRTPVENMTWE
ncbi:hypothetical protein A6R68_07734 [Neotoma lepida]|uniref:Uncharacterized protein n=1 Tax=Neotoma lepida TaxID=56216 RepID=A0A1A6GD85_NEOLE|nr:hypothetical protein A6R68_07734 [Neotoma lepida]